MNLVDYLFDLFDWCSSSYSRIFQLYNGSHLCDWGKPGGIRGIPTIISSGCMSWSRTHSDRFRERLLISLHDASPILSVGKLQLNVFIKYI